MKFKNIILVAQLLIWLGVPAAQSAGNDPSPTPEEAPGVELPSPTATPYLPLELQCRILKKGKSLDCYYGDGITQKKLNDQDLIEFINKSSDGAYITVKSRKNFERAFYLDPTSPELSRFYLVQKNPAASMREIGQAKYAVLAAIETKAMQLSDSMDTAKDGMVLSSDPAFSYQKFKSQLVAMKKENLDIEKSCNQYRNFDAEKSLEASVQEKRYYSHYLSLLIKTLSEPGSCTDSFELKPYKDGSVNLSRINDLVSLFQQKCHPEKPAELANQAAARALYDQAQKARTPADGGLVCAKKFEANPAVFMAGKSSDRPMCVAYANCVKGKNPAEKILLSCPAKIIKGKFGCPAPTACANQNEVVRFNQDNVSVSE